jgi:hypothetical protein
VLRTVTFSNRKVAEVVNANFVPAWFNRSPGFRNSDDAPEKSIFQNSSEAFLTKNICTFILTPDGRVFHYIAGYVSPEIFLRFLDDTLVLHRSLTSGGLATLQETHAGLATDYEQKAKGKATPTEVADRSYRDLTHRHNEACAWQIQETWRYLGRVHRFLEKAAALPSLDEVRYKYLYGNDFSEEGKGASPIASDPAVLVLR